MRVTVPHLGALHVYFQPYIDSLGLEAVVPPPTSKATLDIGVHYCPEMICTPGKIIFGNYAEAVHFCSYSSGGAW